MKIWLSWSSGKDSYWALRLLHDSRRVQVAGLFATVNREFDRVAMHGVRRKLVERQARSLGLPLRLIDLPWPCSNRRYEEIMAAFSQELVAGGAQGVAFGDLFLEDVRNYRIRQLQGVPLKPLFPLWGLPTDRLAEEMAGSGMQAKVVCVDPRRVDRRMAGADFGLPFLAQLPPGVDPCGENGEFHTFVCGGPLFSFPIEVEVGEIVEREGFVYADLVGKDGLEKPRRPRQ